MLEAVKRMPRWAGGLSAAAAVQPTSRTIAASPGSSIPVQANSRNMKMYILILDWTSPNNDPRHLSTQLSFYLCVLSARLQHLFVLRQRWKQVKKVVRRDKMRDWRVSKSFITRRGRYYEHIYPKLENNEERLKPSQYFRRSKWTTSPGVDNGPQRLPDTIMCCKMREGQCESLFAWEEAEKLQWAPLVHISFCTFLCCGDKTGNERSLS